MKNLGYYELKTNYDVINIKFNNILINLFSFIMNFNLY